MRTAPCVKHEVPLERKEKPLSNNQRWDPIQQSGRRYPWTCYPSKNKRPKILVLMDCFTKCGVCVLLERTTAEDVARAIVKNWVLTSGALDYLHTGQGSNFCSELLLEVCKIFGIEKTRTSPYHPQGNGMVERHKRVVADVISKYCANNPSNRDQMIPYLDFVYNTTVHKATGQTPFSLVFRQECKYPIDLLLPKPPVTKLPTTKSQDGSTSISGKHI